MNDILTIPTVLTLPTVVGTAVGLALGALATWTLAAARARTGVAEARQAAAVGRGVGEAALAAERERRETAEAAVSRATDRAESLAHSLAVAEERAEQLAARENQQHGRESAFEARRLELETLLAPMQSALERLDARYADIERERVAAHARMDRQVETLAAATGSLGERATALAAALSGSRTRGRWGEMALRNVIELAGMSEHCDFFEQRTTDEGTRPDVTIRLPGGRFIAVDAKAPLDAYLRASDATAESTRNAALDRHVGALRAHVRALSARGYAAALPGDVDLVILFLPGEPILAAAFGRDPDLQVEALRSRVLIATPATLVALLRTVAIYWQQRDVAKNAEEIAAAARELYARGAAFGEHLARVGGGLRAAVDAYNRAVGSFDARFVPMARRLEELRVAGDVGRRLADAAPIDTAPRSPVGT